MSTTTVDVAERIFSPADLGRLLEITTTIDCECPNHLSKIVTNLQAFETYSKNCENRNEADAEMHAHLYRETAAARAIMERALVDLIRFEEIPGFDL